jgi:hypothetical protein
MSGMALAGLSRMQPLIALQWPVVWRVGEFMCQLADHLPKEAIWQSNIIGNHGIAHTSKQLTYDALENWKGVLSAELMLG